MKICKKCHIEKELDCFYKNKAKKDGLDIYCKSCGNKQTREYNKNNPDKVKLARFLNKEHIRNYSKNNRTTINIQVKSRRKNDPIFKLSRDIRTSINQRLKGKYKKSKKTEEILGCTFEEFKQHIESLWEPWMNWNNHGLYNGELNYGWDIDHIIPASSAQSEDEIYKLNHYTNLQPLCSYINRRVKINSLLS